MNRIAIIGTAGRDKTKPMTLALWEWMVADALSRVPAGAHVVSGGAAWADHLAIELFRLGHAGELTLHLPAPFRNQQFIGPHQSAGNASNYYHGLFSRAIGRNTLADIEWAADQPMVNGSFEPEAEGYAAMFARNMRVAACEEMLAYTFGTGDRPADGGTAHTWDRCRGQRVHVPLPILV